VRYVDGYVLPVHKKNLQAYCRMAEKAGKIWGEHVALEYRECTGDDLKVKFGVPLPRLAKAKPGKTVVFSWIVFKARSHRDRVNTKVMKDQRTRGSAIPSRCPSRSSAWSTAGSRFWSKPNPGLLRHRAQYAC
jgi:uncharacterized protein YbaA (DUF1428 family)